MAARDNNSVICSIAFIGIVEYVTRAVEEQMRAKAQLNDVLAQALAGIPTGERIVLDTAEGVAISFLGDPQDCLDAALSLREALAGRSDDLLRLRVGINLGPVRLVKDLTGQPTIIGDGISVAERILSFADANQILVSGSFYEAVSALTPAHARLFDFLGSRTDRQVREHALYRLNEAQAPPRAPRARQPSGTLTRAAQAQDRSILAAALTQLLRRPPLATALAVALILSLAMGLRLALHRTDAEPATEQLTEAPRQASVPDEASQARQKTPAAAEPSPPPAASIEPPRQPTKPAPRESGAATGTVRLNVAPWGEVYVNGEKAGIAPPLRDLTLKPGRHRIEIRNPGFETYSEAVEIRGGEEIRIRHRFE